MARSGDKRTGFDVKELLSADGDFLRAVMDAAEAAAWPLIDFARSRRAKPARIPQRSPRTAMRVARW